MCNPIAVGVIMAASAAAQHVSGVARANAEIGAAEEAAQTQANEYADARDEKIGDRIREARAAQARMRVAAGEAGVSGASVEAQLRDSAGRANRDLAIADRQSKNANRRINADLKGVYASRKTSQFNAGLQIAAAGVSGYAGAGGKFGGGAKPTI